MGRASWLPWPQNSVDSEHRRFHDVCATCHGGCAGAWPYAPRPSLSSLHPPKPQDNLLCGELLNNQSLLVLNDLRQSMAWFWPQLFGIIWHWFFDHNHSELLWVKYGRLTATPGFERQIPLCSAGPPAGWRLHPVTTNCCGSDTSKQQPDQVCWNTHDEARWSMMFHETKYMMFYPSLGRYVYLLKGCFNTNGCMTCMS